MSRAKVLVRRNLAWVVTVAAALAAALIVTLAPSVRETVVTRYFAVDRSGEPTRTTTTTVEGPRSAAPAPASGRAPSGASPSPTTPSPGGATPTRPTPRPPRAPMPAPTPPQATPGIPTVPIAPPPPLPVPTPVPAPPAPGLVEEVGDVVEGVLCGVLGLIGACP